MRLRNLPEVRHCGAGETCGCLDPAVWGHVAPCPLAGVQRGLPPCQPWPVLPGEA